MNKKIGISTFYFQKKLGDRQALALAAEIGAEGIDFSLCDYDDRRPGNLYTKSEEEIVAYCTALREYAASLGLVFVQTHGRITGYQSRQEEDEALIRNARLDCLATRALGASVCVMHTVSNSVYGADAPAALMHEKNDAFFLSVLPFAKEFEIRIATETYGICGYTKTCETFGLIPEFIAAYDRLAAHKELGKHLTVCMDTGHTHNATQFPGAIPVGEAIRRLGKRIAVLHLHDNNGYADQHTMPMAGTADWQDILQALEETGFDGYYNLELSPTHFGPALAKEEAAFAIKIMRNLLDGMEK